MAKDEVYSTAYYEAEPYKGGPHEPDENTRLALGHRYYKTIMEATYTEDEPYRDGPHKGRWA